MRLRELREELGEASEAALRGRLADLSYPALERRMNALRNSGLVEAAPGDGRAPYRIARWGSEGMAVIVAAASFELLHLPDSYAPLTPADLEAALLVAGPVAQSIELPRVADLAEIRQMIETALPGATVKVLDETGTGDHLRAIVVASQFEGLSRLKQHRLVKAAVKERFDDGAIHALSVKTELPGS
jgi:acid stress-induced BolA-like protein IbaG/YrbA